MPGRTSGNAGPAANKSSASQASSSVAKSAPVGKGAAILNNAVSKNPANTAKSVVKTPVKSAVSADSAERAANKNSQSAAALRKLTSGQSLTAAEKKLLNIAPPAKKPVPPKPPVKKTPAKKTVTKKVVTKTGGGTDEGGAGTDTDIFGSATPYVPDSPDYSVSTPYVKPATPDLILISEEGFPVEMMTDLLFEDVGGTEILGLARHDLINGIDIRYQQISNLSKIETMYGSATLISLQNTSEQVFSKFPLKRYQYVPAITDDPSGFNSPVYLDSSGNVIVEISNLGSGFQIEVEFQSAETNDIMY